MGRKNNKGKKGKGKKKVKKQQDDVRNLAQIPHILGGTFQETGNDIDELCRQIDVIAKERKLKGDTYKRRILYSTEASYLHTGFGTYLREVMRRLHSTGKYELAELGSYGNSPECDPDARGIPWKYYHNMPMDGIEEELYKKDYKENQFGKWKLSYALADFKPDILLLNRDNWMDSYVLKNALRENLLVFWMPTVDGFPQKWSWIEDYSKVDGLFTYSHFGKKVLEDQSRCTLAKRRRVKELSVQDVIQPGVDCDIFFPQPRDKVFKIFGIDAKHRFIGTVMRNQPRKLFTRIIESFRMFKEQYKKESENVFLLLHTSIPDVGWDIPEIVQQNGLEQEVVFSYICQKCKNIGVMNFRGSPSDCPICKSVGTFTTPNTRNGFPDEQFSLIYNLMELYIQGTIAEGDGMPINEAKACGVPVLGSDYSAVAEKMRNGGGVPIKNDTIYTEHETGQWRSLFDRQDLCDKIKFYMSNEGRRAVLAREARECAIKFYDWDLTAKKYEFWIDKVEIKDRNDTWDAPLELKELPQESAPKDSSDKEFVEWCYLKIVSGKKPDAQGFKHWTQTLQKSGEPGTDSNNKTRDQLETFFRKKVEDENKQKMLKSNPNQALVNPVDRARKAIEQYETA